MVSVAVDVPTDVDRETLRSRGLGPVVCLSAPKHLILGQVFLDRLSDRGRDHRSSTSGFGWRPVGLTQSDHAAAQGQPSTQLVCAPCSSAPGPPRGSPWGGRRDATPCSPTQSRRPCAWPSRRPACPARAPSLQIGKIPSENSTQFRNGLPAAECV
jgi:hypothetical protein